MLDFLENENWIVTQSLGSGVQKILDKTGCIVGSSFSLSVQKVGSSCLQYMSWTPDLKKKLLNSQDLKEKKNNK